MYCQACIVVCHRDNPLHCLKEWNSKYFRSQTLKDLGFIFVIVHSNGIHIVNLKFCRCETADTYPQQLLCMHWLPATLDKPCTAATFHVLDDFHIVSLESELSCCEFYNALSHCSDNTGLNLPKAHYEQFLRLVGQCCHLKMLKYLDVLFVALNANFCPRYCAVLNNECNPSLSQGWGHLVEESAFKAYLSDHNNHIQEKSTFSNHNAVNLADVKSKKGCDATGVGMVVCARHSMWLLSIVVDLQCRERYADMDYAFVSALHNLEVTVLKILYDIACQWCKKFFQQMEKMPPSLQLHLHDQDITFLFPKFHLVTHIASCQWPFSFNWTKDVGQMDGREPECGWANLNAAASSPKDMGLSHCQNTLDDYFLQFSEQLASWKQQVEEWEMDSTNSNLFEVRNSGIIQASVHLQLAKDEAKLSMDGSELPLHSNVTVSILISTGINLEDQQYVTPYCISTKLGLSVMDTQQVQAWQIHVLFMPSMNSLWDEWVKFTKQAHSPENVLLCLPSQITGRTTCSHQYHMTYLALSILGPLLD
ncbi:hypothetical protein V8B97DRAFT_2026723 [Scleroderma yunnanense]